MDENELSVVIDKFDLLSTDYKNLAKSIMKQDTQVMKVDLIALSVLNRAVSINNAFKTLVKENNTFAALHLVRIQMDNLIRYYSILIAKDKNYVDYVLDGKPINQFKDSNNKNFSDFYLVETLSKTYADIKDLYEKYCGHIHFGKEHLERIKTISENKQAKFRVEIGNFESYSLKERETFVIDFITISMLLYNIIQDWTLSKYTFVK
ncbi:MAG TPA: hypothetical protein VLZ83_13490 [Edaphocola sp.]|nr:hypothetical protein [Edaphocola sp.]